MIHVAALVILNLWLVGGAYGADRGVKYDRLGRILPSADSKEALIAQLDIVLHRAQEKIIEVKGFSLAQQRTELTKFHEENIKPIKEKIKILDLDIPYIYNIQDLIAQRLVDINFNLAMQNMYNYSSSDFSEAFEHYIRLPQQVSQRQQQSWWKASLIHGNAGQIQTLCARATFLPEQVEPLYKRISTFSAEEQLSCVCMLLKKSISFREVLEKQEKKQGEAVWGLAVRVAIVRGEGKKLLDLFNDDVKKIHDQLFMHTITPFVAIKTAECQKACTYALSAWSQRLCEDDNSSYHSRHLETSKLIDNNPTFKKAFESHDCGVYVSQWWANFHVMLWEASRDTKKHKTCQKDQLLLFKKTEAFFSRISASDASILSAPDNKARLSMHGAVLSTLLDETNATGKAVLFLCENALKSGLNLLEQAYIPRIAQHFSSAKLLALVQPYIQANPAMLCSLGSLYHKGHQIKVDGKPYWWMKQDVEKAKKIYIDAAYKGSEKATAHLLPLMKGDDVGVYAMLDSLCKKFPRSYFFMMQKSAFLCAMLTKNNHPFNQQAVYALDMLKLWNDGIRLQMQKLNARDMIRYTALQASYETVMYGVEKNRGMVFDTKKVMDATAHYVHTAYAFSKKVPHYDMDVSLLFDASVYKFLRDYADTVLEKDPKALNYADLQTMVVTGYMICQLFDKNTLSATDSVFLDRVIKTCLCGDSQGKVPPLAHVLAYLAIYREGSDQKREQLFSHLIAALQKNVTKDELDIVARADAEDALHTMAFDGSILSQMELLMYKKNNASETIKKLAISTKQIIAISKQKRAEYIKAILACGGYAFLKERLLNSNCTDCSADMVFVLQNWIDGLTHGGDKSDSLLKPFFDDLQLINSYRNG